MRTSPVGTTKQLVLSAEHLYMLHRPSLCELRLWLFSQGQEGQRDAVREKMLKSLRSQVHDVYEGTFPSVGVGAADQETLEALVSEHIARPQAELPPQVGGLRLSAHTKLAGVDVTVVGAPDRLIPVKTGWKIQTVRIARNITEDEHAEVLCELELYGWLFEQTFGQAPVALEVFNGKGELVPLAYRGGAGALRALEEVAQIVLQRTEPYSPVGLDKCSGCRYRDYCWRRAEKARDVALVRGIDQNLVKILHSDHGVRTVSELLDRFVPEALAEVRRPVGRQIQRVGPSRARSILGNALALQSKRLVLVSELQFPDARSLVGFDVEDYFGDVYVWGLEVFGDTPAPYRPALTAARDDGGIKRNWFEFLKLAQQLFDTYGDIPFMHYAPYERTMLDKYLARFGDRGQVAERVRANLFDLYTVAMRSVALPTRSWSLKDLEALAGYKREYASRDAIWAMGTYLEAGETRSRPKRERLLRQLADYNREDLVGTWAVYNWLQRECGPLSRAHAAVSPN